MSLVAQCILHMRLNTRKRMQESSIAMLQGHRFAADKVACHETVPPESLDSGEHGTAGRRVQVEQTGGDDKLLP